ncbi:hypothetical protein ACFYPC_11320 [Streptomyces sp. NPDC005808]|uniref:hypothetical protein n=1 Tax=Streptomyces sp. NPDC005808 TaxID=3364734 RepID=UPI003679B08E
MNATGWFACDEGDETEVPNPRYPWQPVLQLEGMQVRLSIWFETKEACQGFITSDVIGKGLHPLQ